MPGLTSFFQSVYGNTTGYMCIASRKTGGRFTEKFFEYPGQVNDAMAFMRTKTMVENVYFCPQLYRYDSDKKLVPLPGEEIGKLIAQSIEGGVVKRRIWYGPSEKLPDQPVISAPPPLEFDTVVVDMASARNSATNSA